MTEVVYKNNKKIRKETVVGYLFILLPLIGFLVFTAISMGVSVVYSFTDFNPVRHISFSDATFTFFTEKNNYLHLFKDEKF